MANVVRWMLGFFSLVVALFTLRNNFVFGLCMLLAGLLLIFLASGFVGGKWRVFIPVWIKWVAGVLVLGLGMLFMLRGGLNKVVNTQWREIVTMSGAIHNKSREERAVVRRVVDGDTVKLFDGEVVRYIGVNTPEMESKDVAVKCYAREAMERNRELVEGKEITMSRDVSGKDKYGRLLRYVYVDGEMINELLVRGGYAEVATYPPDVKYKDLFVEAERLAKKEGLGLWSRKCVEGTENLVKIVY